MTKRKYDESDSFNIFDFFELDDLYTEFDYDIIDDLEIIEYSDDEFINDIIYLLLD